jgi:hypothetical protein
MSSADPSNNLVEPASSRPAISFPAMFRRWIKSIGNWKTDRGNRLIFLTGVFLIWAVIWVGGMGLDRTQMRVGVPLAVGAIVLLWAIIAVIGTGGQRAALRLFLTVAIPLLLWAGIIALATFWDSFDVWWKFLLLGEVMIAGYFVLALFTGSWMIELQAGEIYYRQGLRARLGKLIASPFDDEGTQAESPESMVAQLLGAAADGGDMSLEEDDLRETYRWVRPVDQVWLLWDKKRNPVWVEFVLEDMGTVDGTFPFYLKFAFWFDPEKINARFMRLSLHKWRSMDRLQEVVQMLMRGMAAKAAREFFAPQQVNYAAHQGCIDFGNQIRNKLDWTRGAFGVDIKAWSIECRRVVSPEELKAAGVLRASTAQANADLAKLNLLLDKAMMGGVPANLLTSLAFLVLGPRSLRYAPNFSQVSDPDPNHQFTFYFNNLVQQLGGPEALKKILQDLPSGQLPTEKLLQAAQSAAPAAPAEPPPPDDRDGKPPTGGKGKLKKLPSVGRLVNRSAPGPVLETYKDGDVYKVKGETHDT